MRNPGGMRQCESQHTQAPGSLAGRALAHCGEVARPRLSAAVSPAGGIAWDIEGCIELMAACNRSIKTLLTCILLLMTPLSPASSRSTRRLGRWEDRLPATLCASSADLFTWSILLTPLTIVFFQLLFSPTPFTLWNWEFSSSLSCLSSSLTFLVYGSSMCYYKLW